MDNIRNEKSMNKLKKLYKLTLKPQSSPAVLENYKEHRRILQQVKRKAKLHFYRSRCKDFKNDTRKL